jgi:hypothetical protein
MEISLLSEKHIVLRITTYRKKNGEKLQAINRDGLRRNQNGIKSENLTENSRLSIFSLHITLFRTVYLVMWKGIHLQI